MTVQSTGSRVNYNGDGSTVAFTIPFYFLNNTDIVVLSVSPSGQSTKLFYNVDYTVSGAGVETGGMITATTAPVSSSQIIIYRDPDATQLVDYQDNDPFPAETHELALDKLTMLVQRDRERLDRAFVLDDSDTSGASTMIPSPSGTNVIGWNADGSALVNYSPSSLGTTVAAASWQTQIFSGDGIQTAFVLNTDIGTASNCDVSISGVTRVAGQHFTYNSANKTITFLVAPASATDNVAIRYGTAIPAQALGVADLSNVINTLGIASGGTGATSAGGARSNLGLGSAATLTAGVSSGNLVQLDGSAKLPAVDGSQLTNLPIPTVITAASNPAFDNNSANAASTNWVRGYVGDMRLARTSFSAPYTPTGGETLSAVHGKSAVPYRVQLVLECVSADLGYSIGERVTPHGYWNGSATNAISYYADAANVGVKCPTGFIVYILHKTTGVGATPAASKWKYAFEFTYIA
jgi:hypothetical protein